MLLLKHKEMTNLTNKIRYMWMIIRNISGNEKKIFFLYPPWITIVICEQRLCNDGVICHFLETYIVLFTF